MHGSTVVIRFLPILVSAIAAAAGGTAEDYARAARLPGELSGLVRNERIDPQWVDAENLEFTVTEADGRRVRKRFALAAGAVSDAAGDADDPVRPRRVRRSREGGEPVHLEFANRLEEPLRLVWLDGRGERRPYGELAPGATRRQHTFAGHAWLALDARGEIVAGFEAPSADAAVTIDAATRETYRGLPAPARAARGGRGSRETDASATAPDGGRAIVRRDGGLRLRDAEGGERELVIAEGEGLAFDDRAFWSPDGRFLVVRAVEPVEVRTIPIVEVAPRDELQPRLRTIPYPKPGDPIDRVRLFLFETETGRPIPLDDSLWADAYAIDRFAWNEAGDRFSFLANERGHRALRLVEVDATAGSARAAIDETSPTFVDYAHKTFLHRLPGDRAIWMSERSGWNQLYLADLRAATLAPITFDAAADPAIDPETHPLRGGAWVVRSVDEVREETDGAVTVRFRAMGLRPGEDPYHQHVATVRLAPDGTPGPLVRLTEGDGTHELSLSPDGSHFVDRWSRVDRPPVHELRRTVDGSLVATLAEADASALAPLGWRAPERFVAAGRDGVTPIHGVILVPTTFDPSRRYPVVEHIYAGPQDHFVPKSFATWHGMREIAELGFVVVQIDGMGTNWRSKAFHDVAARNLADAGFPDRIAWLEAAAATRPWMDLGRVGIYGGSAGGQSALGALLFHGDFYAVAVADCGCHDNRVDKRWWNEAWMGYPIGPHYAEQSNVTNAHRLRGDLLLIVGGLDDNVDPASTLQVVDALVKADRDFELLYLPSAGHGAAETPYGKRRRADFLVRKLLGVEPRRAAAAGG